MTTKIPAYINIYSVINLKNENRRRQHAVPDPYVIMQLISK